MLNGRNFTLAPLSPSQVFEDQKRLKETVEKQREGIKRELKGRGKGQAMEKKRCPRERERGEQSELSGIRAVLS